MFSFHCLHLPYTAIRFVTRRFYSLAGYDQSQMKKKTIL